MHWSENSRNKVDAARAGIVSRASYWDGTGGQLHSAVANYYQGSPLTDARSLIADAEIATCVNASREGFGPANQP
jgi:hypothetical protein